jgi:hypothetical protein
MALAMTPNVVSAAFCGAYVIGWELRRHDVEVDPPRWQAIHIDLHFNRPRLHARANDSHHPPMKRLPLP